MPRPKYQDVVKQRDAALRNVTALTQKLDDTEAKLDHRAQTEIGLRHEIQLLQDDNRRLELFAEEQIAKLTSQIEVLLRALAIGMGRSEALSLKYSVPAHLRASGMTRVTDEEKR